MDKIYLSPHFTLDEMTSTKTGLDNTPNVAQTNQLRLLCNDILEPLCDKIGQPIIVNSAFRSPAVNKSVGGVKTSQHLLGQAADIHCQLSAKRLFAIINQLVEVGIFNVGQCILYTNSHFVHVSLPCSAHKNDFIVLNK